MQRGRGGGKADLAQKLQAPQGKVANLAQTYQARKPPLDPTTTDSASHPTIFVRIIAPSFDRVCRTV